MRPIVLTVSGATLATAAVATGAQAFVVYNPESTGAQKQAAIAGAVVTGSIAVVSAAATAGAFFVLDE